MRKLNLAVIYGGTNTEHEVSVVTARSIINNLDQSKFKITPIYITKTNHWTNPHTSQPINLDSLKNFDVVFPALHGPYGEDGTLQGMLDTLHLPYVGCGVLASALCMDKVVQKQLCQPFLPIVPFTYCSKYEWKNLNPSVMSCINKLSYPLFIKPANQGSSVGILKVPEAKDLITSINFSFDYDSKLIIEQAINKPREFEVAIFGNEQPKASVVGEIIASNDFYDYDAKYIDGKSAAIIPAKIDPSLSTQIQNLALQAYKLLNCSGLARVDFLYDSEANQVYLSELNTMPGFTNISMYPKLWQASGLSYPDLLTKLINLAIDHHQQKSQIKLSYTPKSNWSHDSL